ncbi:MAG: hypothetical protein C7B46_06120 [Sulfobacillus benefaciens]|uniref:Metal-binding protein n=1 Tax=Sulfobacillus benefaciens TaxID=453960 RepID=A0A2T2XIM6_9FIRM|nr:MAG: hypothetical protein C7B46_06120 [Sulfobacillus benefaciens]
MAKYRHSKVKRQHHVVKDLEPGLQMLANLESVDGIIPGIISRKSGSAVGFSFQYFTPSGLKLIGRSSGAAQEIFVISHNPELVLESLYQSGLIARPLD